MTTLLLHPAVAAPAARAASARTVTLVRLGWLVATELAAFGGLSVLLEDLWWWFALAAAVIGVTGAATIARRLIPLREARWAWIPSVIALGVGVLVLTAWFAPQTGLLAIVPTADTFGAWGDIVRAGARSIASQAVPAVATQGIQLLIAAPALLIAVLVEFFGVGLGMPAVALIPALGVLVVPLVFRDGIASPASFLYSSALGLLAVSKGTGRAAGIPLPSPSSAVAAAIALVLALGAPAVLPPTAVAPGPPTFLTSVNPIITLGNDLRRGENVVVGEYRADDGSAQYLRLAVLDSFANDSWTPTLPAPDGTRDSGIVPAPEGLRGDVKAETHSIDIQLSGLSGAWLPIPYPVTAIEGIGHGWYWDQSGMALHGTGVSIANKHYQASYLSVAPTIQQLTANTLTGTEAQAVEPDLELPPGTPALIYDVAGKVTQGAKNPYEAAVDIEDYFRGGDFTYSVDAPVADDFDGTGVDAIAQFLTVKSGYCIHFASAMAAMARAVGIPARVVVGFTPGSPDSSRPGSYVVSTDDEHAWPELYFSGVGWLRFEPTPTRGIVPDYTATGTPTTPGGVPGEQGSDGSTAAPTGAADRDLPDQRDGGGLSLSDPSLRAYGNLGLALLIVAAILSIPAVARTVLRRRRIARLLVGEAPAEDAWRELLDTAVDLGFRAPPGETPRAFAARMARTIPDAGAIEGLRDDVERVAYAGGYPGDALERHLRASIRVLALERTRGERMQAVLWPRSVIARVLGAIGVGRSAARSRAAAAQ